MLALPKYPRKNQSLVREPNLPFLGPHVKDGVIPFQRLIGPSPNFGLPLGCRPAVNDPFVQLVGHPPGEVNDNFQYVPAVQHMKSPTSKGPGLGRVA